MPEASSVPEAESQPSLKRELLYRTLDTKALPPLRVYRIGWKLVPRAFESPVMCGAQKTCRRILFAHWPRVVVGLPPLLLTPTWQVHGWMLSL